mmetsp:Transcript_9796/g.35892  ORF Transcript_9796/g.35892 Transcript_9796/m.35892 type:complete len:1892 (-) Transcript_9796:99-5774(-)
MATPAPTAGKSESRLDRLFKLIHTGSSNALRKAAAQQIAELAVSSESESFFSILNKLQYCMVSTSWETRTAAGHALGAISQRTAKGAFDLQQGADNKDVVAGSAVEECVKRRLADENHDGALSFDAMDFVKVLDTAKPLVSSGGEEFDLVAGSDGTEGKAERVAKARANLRKRLGLDTQMGQFVDVDGMIVDDDLEVGASATNTQTEQPEKAEDAGAMLSSRERNRLKRLAKKGLKRRGAEGRTDDGKRVKTAVSGSAKVKIVPQELLPELVDPNDLNDNGEGAPEMEGRDRYLQTWSFAQLCDNFSQLLFHPKWEIRHGACVALREVLTWQARNAGVLEPTELSLESIRNHDAEALLAVYAENICYLQELACRLLCVLGLDRFGDFVSDKSVAPVRETCAQTLTSCLRALPNKYIWKAVECLMSLHLRSEWQSKHAGFLGIKYLLAAKPEMLDAILPRILGPAIEALQGKDDDVRGAVAEALLPGVEQLMSLPQVPHLLGVLWESLSNLDDLSASTENILRLLASIHKQLTESSLAADLDMTEMVPRLFPFLRHTLRTVRNAAIHTLRGLVLVDSIVPKTEIKVEQGEAEKASQDLTGSLRPASWGTSILGELFGALMENALLEEICDEANLGEASAKDPCSKPITIQEHSIVTIELMMALYPQESIVARTSSSLTTWLELASTPCGAAIKISSLGSNGQELKGSNIPISMSNRESEWRVRSLAARALGALARVYFEVADEREAASVSSGKKLMETALLRSLQGASVVRREVSALVLQTVGTLYIGHGKYGKGLPVPAATLINKIRQARDSGIGGRRIVVPESLRPLLLGIITQDKAYAGPPAGPVGYSEVVAGYARVIQSAKNLMSNTELVPTDDLKAKLLQGFPSWADVRGVHLSHLSQQFSTLCASVTPEPSKPEVGAKITRFNTRLKEAMDAEAAMHTGAQATLATAIISLGKDWFPPKSNPLIQPLMSTIRRSSCESRQQLAARGVASLMFQLSTSESNPNSKLVRNLCTMACSYVDIELKEAERSQTAGSKAKDSSPNPTVEIAKVAEAGGRYALCEILRIFKESLVQRLPDVWNTIGQALVSYSAMLENAEHLPVLQRALFLLSQISSAVDGGDLRGTFETLCSPLMHICTDLRAPPTVQKLAATSIASLLTDAECLRDSVMIALHLEVIPSLGNDSEVSRRGAARALRTAVEAMSELIVPHVILLLVPTLSRMSDPDDEVRLNASATFSLLVPLLPLARGIPAPPAMPTSLLQKAESDMDFFEQLLDNKQVHDFSLPVPPIDKTLRPYQQEGVNWLAFLRRFGLHGALCDDMGLGKTLQAGCMLAADLFERRKAGAPLPSIVVCPAILIAHWAYELSSYFSDENLQPLEYAGVPQARNDLRGALTTNSVLITSYEVVRSDLEWLQTLQFGYCILDEGHSISNPKAKTSQAVKELRAHHRLILTGTPIQNRPSDVWSLFDFLMPGFLGSSTDFHQRFGKAIQNSRNPKNARDVEAGALAIESLHKQIMPFVMRRKKDQVLKDLPPKIIQDYYCELSPLQERLYEAFQRSNTVSDVQESLTNAQAVDKTEEQSSHVFQALHYLRRLCSHPSLVLDPANQRHVEALGASGITIEGASRADQSPKLMALRQLLLDCGIGGTTPDDEVGLADGTSSGHRVLVFAQLRSFLDIVQDKLFAKDMPSVTFLRLDGSIEASQRFNIVRQFNSDPSIQVLLLTTSVGGLGLNLTSADTVIFLEHDWNPMKDLQAMDRAHRLGQTRTVNVYRLITKGTLEEKIMGLQRFKLHVANTVFNTDNASLQSMDTSQLLSLFAGPVGRQKSAPKAKSESGLTESEAAADHTTGAGALGAGKGKAKTGLQAMLSSLQELWDESQYEEEYNLDAFIEKMR